MKTVLGVQFTGLNWAESAAIVSQYLRQEGIHYVFTPNPEMIVDAHRDRYFRDTLNTGDLNICDGFGVSLLTGLPRVPGVDFADEICRLAVEQDKTVYLLGTGQAKSVQVAAIRLQTRFPGIRVVGVDPGYSITLKTESDGVHLQYNAVEHEETINRLIMAAPDVLLVALGHNKQEKWIVEFAHQIPSLKIAMGVGGTLGYWAGTARRAPRWLQKLGLEWLWRLVWEPKRIGRIVKAVIVFPILFLASKCKYET